MERVKELFEKYLNRTASSEELEEMFHLLRNKSDFEALYLLFEKEWESKDVEFKLDETSWEDMQSQMIGRKMVSSSDPAMIRFFRSYWKMTATAAAVLLIAGMFLWSLLDQQTQVFETGFGETREIVMNDHSRVILNANSKLVWHKNWRDTKERKVELEGEAFFIVKRYASQNNSLNAQGINNRLMPFRVITPDLTVNVIGTSFNVMARRQTTDVYLESGEVLLTKNNSQKLGQEIDRHPENDLSWKPARDSIYMIPGDHIQYAGSFSNMTRYMVDSVQNQTSWIDGNLVFENQMLKTALRKLEDIYGKTFEVEDTTLLERPVNLGLPYEDWETVAGLMTLSLEIEFIETQNKIKVKRK